MRADVSRIAGHLAALRAAAGLSRIDLAHRAGCTRRAIDYWESGERIPDVAKLAALADVFGVTLDHFVRP